MIPRRFALSVEALSLIAIVAQAVHAHEHSHRDFYKAHADHSASAKYRGHNFTLVDRYEGRTFFECVWSIPTLLYCALLLIRPSQRLGFLVF